MSHFSMATFEVRDLDQSIAMIALKGRLQKNSLVFSLKKKYLKNFTEMLDRTKKYIRAEEAFKKHGILIDVMTDKKKEDPKLSPI